MYKRQILQGMLPYEMGGLIGKQFAENYKELLPLLGVTPKPPPASLFYHPAQSGDGRWLQFGNLLPHLFDAFLIATGLVDILADPDYEPGQCCSRTRRNMKPSESECCSGYRNVLRLNG